MSDKPRWEIIHGDSLTVLESFPPSTFDAVITDPPYASGGRTQAEKSKATAKKYSSMGGNAATAGAQVKNHTVQQTLDELLQSINKFYES